MNDIADPFFFAFLFCAVTILVKNFYIKPNIPLRHKLYTVYNWYNAFFNKMNRTFHSGLHYDSTPNLTNALVVEESKKKVQQPPKKYEDKYLDYIRATKKEFEFTDEELLEMTELVNTTKETIQRECSEKMEEYKKELQQLNLHIFDLEMKKMNPWKKVKIENDSDQYNSDESETESDDDNAFFFIQAKKERSQQLRKELPELEKRLKESEQEAAIRANAAMIEKRIQKLEGCFAMESTPLGNVLMYYNAKRESFSYYSDFTVPYRYLEVVARKFVKTFHCRPLFINMEEELRETEKKLEEQKKKDIMEKESIEKNSKNGNGNGNANANQNPNKNVFAKLKNYNKATGKVNTAPPSKSSIPNKNSLIMEENKHILLKENANRYTYEGKISTFSICKKVERKAVDKKYALSFADFKRLQEKKEQ